MGSVNHGVPSSLCPTDRLANKEKEMKPFEKCPVCGSELVEKEVEKLLKDGVHTAVFKASAEVCLQCGERVYAAETVKRFEQIREKLEKQDVSEFQPLGQTCRAA